MTGLLHLALLVILGNSVTALNPTHTQTPSPHTTEGNIHKSTACKKYMANRRSKRYQVTYESDIDRNVLCDAYTDGGGWIVFQVKNSSWGHGSL
ncbi:hypothetical protein ElyMa_005292600 [Elysia marginata]|uniref:Fibrinogen C-terminal domain-containing protein n=1 Tax=Elysia marginata TaxID=1093978 RepID=A0AAV4K260_9GAST|nr:hypothetical protein ElyMa_005292600 [Elysia marginata]